MKRKQAPAQPTDRVRKLDGSSYWRVQTLLEKAKGARQSLHIAEAEAHQAQAALESALIDLKVMVPGERASLEFNEQTLTVTVKAAVEPSASAGGAPPA